MHRQILSRTEKDGLIVEVSVDTPEPADPQPDPPAVSLWHKVLNRLGVKA